MIWHIVLAALLTWLVLVGLLHLILFVVSAQCTRTNKPMEEHVLYDSLVIAGVVVLAPIYVPVMLARCAQKRHRRMVTVDMRMLSKDEQRQWIERLNSDEPTEQVAREAMARAREVQESSK